MGNRYYKDESGKNLPSVTTILSVLGDVALMRWANSLGFRHINYDKELNRTAVQGSKIHTWVQNIVTANKKMEFDNGIDRALYDIIVTNLDRILCNHQYSTISIEKSLISQSRGYGGTLDWLVNIDGLDMLVDIKTSKAVREKHLLQLGGYYNLLQDNGIDVPVAGILLINQFQGNLFTISKETLIQYGEAFDNLANYYNLLNAVPMQLHSFN